ncbi:MAG: FAD binding domain-containing protein [Alphaproteobacteria bacterium]
MYAEYDLDIPETLNGALGILADANDSKTVPLAGGTNLIVDIRSKRERPERVVGLSNIDELRGLDSDGARISIGARTTVSDLLAWPEIAAAAPSLIDSANVFAGQMVRNAATVGGNIACGSPVADLVPPLMSLDAEVTLTSKSGTRSVALDDYYIGYKQDVRRPDELIAKISWLRLPENSVNSFYKLARRKGDAITITGVAVTLAVANGKCAKARIVLGAVSPVVLRAKKAEAILEGAVLTPALIDAAAVQAVEECRPIDDMRASADYRRHTVEALTRRLVSAAWQELC